MPPDPVRAQEARAWRGRARADLRGASDVNLSAWRQARSSSRSRTPSTGGTKPGLSDTRSSRRQRLSRSCGPVSATRYVVTSTSVSGRASSACTSSKTNSSQCETSARPLGREARLATSPLRLPDDQAERQPPTAHVHGSWSGAPCDDPAARRAEGRDPERDPCGCRRLSRARSRARGRGAPRPVKERARRSSLTLGRHREPLIHS